MTPPYRVTLVNLTAGATAVAPNSDKLELGVLSADEIYQLAEKLLTLDVGANPKAEPGIIVQRGEKGWRIGAYSGRLRVYKSTSLFDEYWTVENANGLAQLSPFSGQPSSNTSSSRSPKSRPAQPKRFQAARSIFEVVGLFALGVALIAVGFHFGLPHRKLSDLPSDVVIVSESEQTSVFSAVAGSYVAGKVKPGESIVIISPDGHVSLGTIGKDGKPSAPRLEEQAKAARKGSTAAVVTTFGVIAELPPDAVNVGNGHWRKLMTN